MNPFLKALFVQPPCIMGRQLKPFSAYHVAALQAMRSPFVAGGPVTWPDVAEAVHILCYDSIDGPAALFPEPDLAPIIESAGGLDLDATVADLDTYLSDCLDEPEIFLPAKEGEKGSGLPRPWLEVCLVLQNIHGISEYDAWNMPWSKLVSYRCAILESKGGAEIEIVDDASQKLLDLKAAIEENAERERNGNTSE